jgi:transcriptional regulator with XRE-family HTH domain
MWRPSTFVVRVSNSPVPRKKHPPVDREVARTIGGLLRGLRKAAGYRAVKDAARAPGCPAAQQTIYAYERGGLVPNLRQFLELVEFYGLKSEQAPDGDRVRYMGVAAVHAALSSSAYHVVEALALAQRLQPAPSPGRRRRTPAAPTS